MVSLFTKLSSYWNPEHPLKVSPSTISAKTPQPNTAKNGETIQAATVRAFSSLQHPTSMPPSSSSASSSFSTAASMPLQQPLAPIIMFKTPNECLQEFRQILSRPASLSQKAELAVNFLKGQSRGELSQAIVRLEALIAQHPQKIACIKNQSWIELKSQKKIKMKTEQLDSSAELAQGMTLEKFRGELVQAIAEVSTEAMVLMGAAQKGSYSAFGTPGYDSDIDTGLTSTASEEIQYASNFFFNALSLTYLGGLPGEKIDTEPYMRHPAIALSAEWLLTILKVDPQLHAEYARLEADLYNLQMYRAYHSGAQPQAESKEWEEYKKSEIHAAYSSEYREALVLSFAKIEAFEKATRKDIQRQFLIETNTCKNPETLDEQQLEQTFSNALKQIPRAQEVLRLAIKNYRCEKQEKLSCRIDATKAEKSRQPIDGPLKEIFNKQIKCDPLKTTLETVKARLERNEEEFKILNSLNSPPKGFLGHFLQWVHRIKVSLFGFSKKEVEDQSRKDQLQQEIARDKALSEQTKKELVQLEHEIIANEESLKTIIAQLPKEQVAEIGRLTLSLKRDSAMRNFSFDETYFTDGAFNTVCENRQGQKFQREKEKAQESSERQSKSDNPLQVISFKPDSQQLRESSSQDLLSSMKENLGMLFLHAHGNVVGGSKYSERTMNAALRLTRGVLTNSRGSLKTQKLQLSGFELRQRWKQAVEFMEQLSRNPQLAEARIESEKDLLKQCEMVHFITQELERCKRKTQLNYTATRELLLAEIKDHFQKTEKTNPLTQKNKAIERTMTIEGVLDALLLNTEFDGPLFDDVPLQQRVKKVFELLTDKHCATKALAKENELAKSTRPQLNAIIYERCAVPVVKSKSLDGVTVFQDFNPAFAQLHDRARQITLKSFYLEDPRTVEAFHRKIATLSRYAGSYSMSRKLTETPLGKGRDPQLDFIAAW